MRSVFAFISDDDIDSVRAWLDRIAMRGKPNDRWSWPEGKARLFLHLCREVADMEEEEVAPAVAALGGEPTCVVQVDVSGRVPGNAELEQFLGALLMEFRGVVQDDHTNYAWTLDEIRNRVLVDRHEFFDTQGWHRKRLP